jgi:hypothetical protein
MHPSAATPCWAAHRQLRGEIVVIRLHPSLEPVLHRIEERRCGPPRIRFRSVRVREMDDCNHLGMIRADEQYVVAVLPDGDRTHIPTLERMTGPQLRRKLLLELCGAGTDRHPGLEKLHRHRQSAQRIGVQLRAPEGALPRDRQARQLQRSVGSRRDSASLFRVRQEGVVLEIVFECVDEQSIGCGNLKVLSGFRDLF